MTRMFDPPHPGLTLRDDVLPALGVGVGEAAKQLGVSRVAFSRVVNGRAAISPELALRLEAWLGIDRGGDAAVWLAEQSAYDLWQAEQALKDKPARVGGLPEIANFAEAIADASPGQDEGATASESILPPGVRATVARFAAEDGVDERGWILGAVNQQIGWRRHEASSIEMTTEVVASAFASASASATAASSPVVVGAQWQTYKRRPNAVPAEVRASRSAFVRAIKES